MERFRDGVLRLKIGISNVPRSRHAQLAANGWKLRDMTPILPGPNVRRLEAAVLAWLDANNIPRGYGAFSEPFDGYTESWIATKYAPQTVAEIATTLGIDITPTGIPQPKTG